MYFVALWSHQSEFEHITLRSVAKIGYGDAGGHFASAKWAGPVVAAAGFRIQGAALWEPSERV